MLSARHGNCSSRDAELGRSKEIPPVFTVSAAPHSAHRVVEGTQSELAGSEWIQRWPAYIMLSVKVAQI